jgi:hypothetical protein
LHWAIEQTKKGRFQMGKAIRIHLAKDGKLTFCGIAINKNIPIAKKGENFFELEGKPIRFVEHICKNCGSLFAKSNVIYRNYIERVKSNESLIAYEDKLPKTMRTMKLYCAKRKLNWNKNSKLTDKLQANSNTSKFEEVKKSINDSFDPAIESAFEAHQEKQFEKEFTNSNNEEIIELTEVVNPIAIGQKSEKGKARELRKKGLLPVINWKQIPEAIDRIEDGHPIAIVRGFRNTWKVVEEFCSIGNNNNSMVRELTGWVPIELARKVYNQAIMNRVFTE